MLAKDHGHESKKSMLTEESKSETLSTSFHPPRTQTTTTTNQKLMFLWNMHTYRRLNWKKKWSFWWGFETAAPFMIISCNLLLVQLLSLKSLPLLLILLLQVLLQLIQLMLCLTFDKSRVWANCIYDLCFIVHALHHRRTRCTKCEMYSINFPLLFSLSFCQKRLSLSVSF